MTGKRFEFREATLTGMMLPYVYDKVEQEYLNPLKCVALLNEFVDKNEQLKEERGYFERKKCEYFNKYNKKHLDNIQLKEENEQLKNENKGLQGKASSWKITASEQILEQAKLMKENKQLKQFIQELTTKGTGKIHLANGSIYKVNAILTNIKGD